MFRAGQSEVLHTRTHAGACFVPDRRSVAGNRPMGIFTGDFSRRFDRATDFWRRLPARAGRGRSIADENSRPTPQSGRPTGRALAAVFGHSSTVGYEKLFNLALQFHDERCRLHSGDQPETPFYFGGDETGEQTGPVRNLSPRFTLRRLRQPSLARSTIDVAPAELPRPTPGNSQRETCWFNGRPVVPCDSRPLHLIAEPAGCCPGCWGVCVDRHRSAEACSTPPVGFRVAHAILPFVAAAGALLVHR